MAMISMSLAFLSFSTPSSQSMALYLPAVQHRWPTPATTRFPASCTASLASVLVSFHAKEGASNVFLSSRRSPNPCSVVAASSLRVNSFERYCCNSCWRDHDNSSSLSFPAKILRSSLRACLHWSRRRLHLNFSFRSCAAVSSSRSLLEHLLCFLYSDDSM